MNPLEEYSVLSPIYSILKDKFNKGLSLEQTAEKTALPYRTILKDKFNKMYADQLKQIFRYLSVELQIEFEKFTQDLMKEEYISRHSLLDAIDDFYKINFRLCEKDISAWHRFTDNAFNYRPYNPY